MKWLEGNICELVPGDALYPKRLTLIPDPPKQLYVLGGLPEENRPTAAIIGARECSEYGKFVAKKLGEALGKYGIQVISGMARGIDGISQEAALHAGGTSFAVLGSGVDVCYPLSNRGLYEELILKGGILSEYPPGTPAIGRLFPARNRIVSGLADVLIVVEAREKSGTLITVDMALEQGKEVYIVPGRITDRLSDGCNRLIKMGAGVLLNPDSFVEEFWGIAGQKKAAEPQMSLQGEEKKVYDKLEPVPLGIAEINARLDRPMEERKLATMLMKLCLEGVVEQASPGCFYKKMI